MAESVRQVRLSLKFSFARTTSVFSRFFARTERYWLKRKRGKKCTGTKENMGVNKINSGKQAWSDWALASMSWPNYSSEDINIAHTHTRYDPTRMKVLRTFAFRGHGRKAPYADNMLELSDTHYCLSELGLSQLLNNKSNRHYLT